MILATLAIAVAPNLCTSNSTVPDDLAFQQMAESFLKRHDQADADRRSYSPDRLLQEEFFLTQVGLFEVWFPMSELNDKANATDYRDICVALSRAQHEWIDWLGKGPTDRGATVKRFEALEDWIEDWSLSDLARAQGPGATALDTCKAKDGLRAISDELAATMQDASILGQHRQASAPIRLVLIPSRRDFVEFIAFAGWFLPGSRQVFWTPGITTWTEFRIDDLQVIAMEYATNSASLQNYGDSISMKDKSPTGLEEQVVQLALNKLLAYEHGDAMPTELIRGISLNLVLSLYGECHARIDGDLSGRVTAKREVFVRGGRSEGGLLPPNSAESRWRQEYGRHHFARTLEQVQKSGASHDKRSRNKYASFLLINELGSERYVTHAPLLGPAAGPEEVVPDAVYGDYLEFTRAYRAAFLYWLQFHGQSSKKKSATSFGEFLSRLSSGAASDEVAAVAEEIYGKPLSDPKLTTKSLEGRFLRWVSKQ